MKQYDFERIRPSTYKGWELTGLIESPYVKGKGPLTAQFQYIVQVDGKVDDNQTLETPGMVALRMDELVDGTKARIHDIPASLVEHAKGLFERTAFAKPKASNDDCQAVQKDRQQMAASISEPRPMMGGK